MCQLWVYMTVFCTHPKDRPGWSLPLLTSLAVAASAPCRAPPMPSPRGRRDARPRPALSRGRRARRAARRRSRRRSSWGSAPRMSLNSTETMLGSDARTTASASTTRPSCSVERTRRTLPTSSRQSGGTASRRRRRRASGPRSSPRPRCRPRRSRRPARARRSGDRRPAGAADPEAQLAGIATRLDRAVPAHRDHAVEVRQRARPRGGGAGIAAPLRAQEHECPAAATTRHSTAPVRHESTVS